MVSRFKISNEEWSEVKDSLSSRDTLSVKLYKIFLGKLNIKNPTPTIQRLEIVLPAIVTKEERHIIHTMTLKNLFKSESSYDHNNNRRIRIYFSKPYVSTLFERVQEEKSVKETENEIQEVWQLDAYTLIFTFIFIYIYVYLYLY
jgi:hypothetical protein